MLDVHLPGAKSNVRGFVLPREYLIALRIVNGWTVVRAASLAEVTPGCWAGWEHGEHRMQGAAWRYVLLRAGLAETWRPTSALCRYASTLVERRARVDHAQRELDAVPPGPEPILAWRRAQREALDAAVAVRVPVERVVLRLRRKGS